MKKSVLFLLFVLAGTMAMAQEDNNRDAENRVVRGPYETNRFSDNIFLGVAGGVNIYNGENDSYAKIGKRLAPALDFNIGKWFTPSVGARIGYNGLSAKGWTPDADNSPYATGASDANAMYKEKFNVSYLHLDFMWNISNAFGGYKETRTWNFVPFIGAGWVRSFKDNDFDNEMGATIGLLNTIRLGSAVDLTLEGRNMFVRETLDGVVKDSKWENMFSVTLGLTFKFNQRGFKRVEHAAPADYTPYLSRIAALEGTNGELNKKNTALAAEIKGLRDRPATEIVKNETQAAPVALFFNIGKATLDSKELTNLDFYVKHAINADKNKVFTLTGSADKQTGSQEFNQRLSQQRVDYVYNLLVEKYGIAPARLVKKAAGAENNRFSEASLNRCVIVE